MGVSGVVLRRALSIADHLSGSLTERRTEVRVQPSDPVTSLSFAPTLGVQEKTLVIVATCFMPVVWILNH